MMLLFLIVIGFVIGSVPFGLLIARIKGIDLRKTGSGNIGATNVLRAVGKVPALLTLIGDILKGTIAVALGGYFLDSRLMEGIVGLAAIAGHNFPLFLGFKGGKGVATSIGVLILFAPKAALITLALWLGVALITRYSSLGAIVSFGLLPLNVYLFDYTKEKLIISVIIASLLLIRHSVNIKRLLNGSESRIGERV
ncbi:MAG: glycerol-3-phosphate 1-O-acyltransferase PlsY [Nitrospirota bacterium]